MLRKRALFILLALVMTGCAGFNKGCSKWAANEFGSDWIVVQYTMDGKPFHCWKLQGASVTGTEGGSVDWQDRRNSHLVHITGWENRVQVVGGDFESAGNLVGIDSAKCNNGVYPSPSIH